MKRKIFLITLITLLFISCGKGKDRESNTKAENLGHNAEKFSTKKEDEVDKYNAYVQIHNSLSRIDEEIDYYLSEAGSSETVIKHENPGIGFSGINQKLIDSIKETSVKKPEMKELDAAAEKLASVLSEFLPVGQEADRYYDGKDFLSDGYAKAQEIHIKLLNQIKKYDPVASEFRSAMKKRAKEVQQKNLEEYKKAGYLIRYSKVLLMSVSEEFVDEMENQRLDGSNFINGDASKFKPIVEKLNTAIDEYIKVSKDPEQLQKEGEKHSSSYERFGKAALEFKASAATLVNRIETKKAPSDIYLKTPNLLERDAGTPENIYREFNELVAEYNRSER